MEKVQADKGEESFPCAYSPDMYNDEYELYDLVPYESILSLLEAHQQVVQVPISLVSPSSEPLISLGWRPICKDFHRTHPESCKACIENNKAIQARLFEGGTTAGKCANGLWDIAMPIMAGRHHLATIFVRQFFLEDDDIDMEFFRTQARRYNFDEPLYLANLKQVPRLSRAHVNQIVDYTTGLVEVLAELGLKNLQLTREIRERQVAEYALMDGERRYKALIENVPGVVYLCLNDGEYTTVFISKAIEVLTGFQAQTMIDEAMPIMDLIHPEDRDMVSQTVNGAVASGETYVLTYRLLHKDGNYTWVEERGQAVLDEAGEPRFLQGVIFDISEHHRFEEERRKLDAQVTRAHKSESLAVLAGGIAHDFNNLLVGILGHAELVREDILRDTPAFNSLEAIIEASHKATEMTRLMLAYSGKGHFSMEPADLSYIVHEAQALFRSAFFHDFTILYDLGEHLPLVCVDIGQVNQVVVSLVTNAAESYAGEPGEIIVRTGSVVFNRTNREASYLGQNIPEGKYVLLEVADKGCGMAEDTMRRVCDPFFSTKFTGRGLSMAAVLGIARGHNAYLKIESGVGRGSTIRLFFPAQNVTLKKMVAEPKTNVKRNNPKVLLVDDDALVRNAVCRMLAHGGFKPLPADSGATALDLLRHHDGEIGCIILDLTMPEMNGETTLRAIREIAPNLPVILSSGYTRETALACLADLNISAFLQKPYDIKTLCNTLNSVLMYS